jgi:regulator of sirC expression with transglutaminase-like and TPR domain
LNLPFFIANLNAWHPLISKQYFAEDSYMGHLEAIREEFKRQVEGPEAHIDLVQAALLIARTAFPDLVSSDTTDRLDQLAEGLKKRLGPSPSAGDILSHLNRILFDEAGLRGDTQNYYDPQNSFLNRVLERKLGIPITLSLVYSEVGRRAGFQVYGIALPGHFIAGLFHTSGWLYIDPFNQGEILTDQECRRMIQARYGAQAAMDESWKTPADKKAILKRMLRNLKAIYRQLGQHLQVLEMLQWILAVDPDAPEELKERGLLYESMGNGVFAIRDLERYLTVAPASEDKATVTQMVAQLKQSQRWMH